MAALDSLDHREQLDLPDAQVVPVDLVDLDLLVQLVHLVQLEDLDSQVVLEHEETQEPLVALVILDHQACLEVLVHVEDQEVPVSQALLEPLALLVCLVLLV